MVKINFVNSVTRSKVYWFIGFLLLVTVIVSSFDDYIFRTLGLLFVALLNAFFSFTDWVMQYE